jgi:hypothetical protein
MSPQNHGPWAYPPKHITRWNFSTGGDWLTKITKFLGMFVLALFAMSVIIIHLLWFMS